LQSRAGLRRPRPPELKVWATTRTCINQDLRTRSSPCPRSLVSARCAHAAVLARCSVSTLWCCVCAVSCLGEACPGIGSGSNPDSIPVWLALVVRSAQRYPQRSSALRCARFSHCGIALSSGPTCVIRFPPRDLTACSRLNFLLPFEQACTRGRARNMYVRRRDGVKARASGACQPHPHQFDSAGIP